MRRLSFIRSLYAMTGRGTTDVEIADELTDGYFGSRRHWQPDRKKYKMTKKSN